jgi:hypothetical protein
MTLNPKGGSVHVGVPWRSYSTGRKRYMVPALLRLDKTVEGAALESRVMRLA